MLAIPKRSRLTFTYIASSAPARVEPFAVLRSLRTGRITIDRVPALTTFTADRTRQAAASEGELTSEASEVVGAGIDGSIALDRGQMYAELEYRVSGNIFSQLTRSYLYAGGTPGFETREESGPGGGEGFLSWVEIFHDRAGNAAAVDFSLAEANTFRKVYGLAWYYHCSSDVADRTLNAPAVANLGGAKPTGFTTTGNNALFWNTGANITLSADQEGAHISLATEGKDGRTVTNDQGVQTIASTAGAPTPWPLRVTEDELGIIRFPAITLGEVLDTHSAYVLIEEWLLL